MQNSDKPKAELLMHITALEGRIREMEQQQKQAAQLKDEFLNTVSHELRTPLTTIRESVSQVLDGILGETTQMQREFLTICLQDVDRLMRIINGLLDISKLEADKVELKRETVNMVELIKRVVSSFASKAQAKGLKLQVSCKDDTIEAEVDADKVIQVLTNLIGNALKFTDNGSVEVSLCQKDNFVECAVRDSGIGIAEKDLPKVFDKFEQFGRTYGPGEKGTGLGLAISKSIVELHKGTIKVESTRQKGTTFTFILPKQFTAEQILHERIEAALRKAKKDEKEITIFTIKVSDYTPIAQKLGSEKAHEMISAIVRALENTIVAVKTIMVRNSDEIAVCIEANKQRAANFLNTIRRVMKQIIFEMSEDAQMNSSYGYASYPADAHSVNDLLRAAHDAVVSDESIRQTENILVVDDDRQVVQLVKDALNEFGYRNVSEAGDGEEALEKLRTQEFNLVILDMMMPKMNGYEVVGRLKENTKTSDIPIIIMSGHRVEYDRLSEYIKEKAIPILGKPLTISYLKRFVNYLL